MNVVDPIADLLTRIRNAQKAGHEVVSIPASKMKIAIVHLFHQEGYVRAYKCVRDTKQGMIKVALKYDESGLTGTIAGVRRWSRPARRYYVGVDKIPYIKNGFGIGVLSTSQGVMTCRQARAAGLGGEYLCSIY